MEYFASKIIVTSILRTKDDVAKLRTRNGNATENSCHLYERILLHSIIDIS